MYDLTRFSLDAVNAELTYRHTVDIIGTIDPAAGSASGGRVSRRRVLRRRTVRHEDYSNGINS